MREFKKGRLSTEFYLVLVCAFFGGALTTSGYQLAASSLSWERVATGISALVVGGALIISSVGAYVSSRASVKAAASSPTPVQGRGAV